MRHLDFAPFYRSTIGFDHLFTNMLDSVGQGENAFSYPPYDIERTGENSYCISMAIAGFAPEEVLIEAHQGKLTINGQRLKAEENSEGKEILYRGIASRSFTRCFQLADHVEVAGAALENGLLQIELHRNIPEAMKPKKISISSSKPKLRRIETNAMSG